MTYNEIEMNKMAVAKVMCMQSIMFHTRFFFMEQYKRKFVVNWHHERICEALDNVLLGKLTKVMINIAPRYSKTELAVKNFCSNGFIHNPASKFIHLSYSDTLAHDNSEAVKEILRLEKYRIMFPNVQIKHGSDSKKKWQTLAGGGMYATATGGQVTGFGAGAVDDPEALRKLQEAEDELYQELADELDQWRDINAKLDEFDTKEMFAGALIIDDSIKPDDAESEVKRVAINNRYDSTIKNRVNSRRTPQIIMQQRTHPNDLCGHLMDVEGYTDDIDEAMANPLIWYRIAIPVIQTDEDGVESALWPFKHTLPELHKMLSDTPTIFNTQYMQDPKPKEGLMYDEFRTYVHIPSTLKSIRKSYIDSADKGKDKLCSIAYDETETAMYVLDVIYTGLRMRDTKPMVAQQQTTHKVNICRIESNNGGGEFSEGVETQTRAMKNYFTKFENFHQSDNKEVRILDNSDKVHNLIYMPHDWAQRWPLFYRHVTQYLKSGKNSGDDAEDVLTGMAEFFGEDALASTAKKWAGGFR